MTAVKTWVLLSAAVYKIAVQSAHTKDSTKDYRTLQNDRSWTLIYNPETEDGIFVKKLNAHMYLPSGYYEAFPQVGLSRTIQQNILALNSTGWPAIEGI